MAYNYDKTWLDKQEETIKLLVKLANQEGEAIYQFDDGNTRKNFATYINNVKASLAVFYPQFANVHRVIRTWTEIDHDSGALLLHVGTIHNYHAAPRMTTTHQGRKFHELKLRGSPPTGAATITRSPLEVLGMRPTPGEDPPPSIETITEDELIEDATILHRVATSMAVEANNTKLITFTNTKLNPKDIQTTMESLPQWTVEDYNPPEGTVTSLTLRRRDTE